MIKLEMVNMENENPAGFIPESELKTLSKVEDPAGGTLWACVIVGGVIAGSIALCPTTKCTSQCNT